MPTAVLDQVAALQQKDQGRRSTSWLQLVAAYVDDDLPAAAKVAAVFKECGKTRTDLERAAVLLREYRALQQQVSRRTALQAELEQQAAAAHDALTARDAAQKALQDAQDRVITTSGIHAATSHAMRTLRNAEREMLHAKFNDVVDREPTLSAAELELTADITAYDRKLEEVAAQIVKQRQWLASLEQEAEQLPGREMEDHLKQEKAVALNASIGSAMRSIDALEGQQYYLTADRSKKRRELRELQAGL